MHASKTRPSAHTGPLAVALCALLAAPAAHAQVTNYSAFKIANYQQTGPVAPVTPTGYFFGSQTTVTDSVNDASTATVTLPDTTTYSATLSGNTFFYDSPFYVSKADFDAAYPNGTYMFAVDGGDGSYTPDSGQLTITSDVYPAAVPAFDAGTVAALVSYDPSGDFTFHFNAFTQDPNANTAFTFFDIFDATTGTLVPGTDTSFAPASATSVTIPGGTLSPDHAYQVVLDFSNRQDTGNAGFFLSDGALATVGFDDRTGLDFTTAPEPPAFAGLALGALGLAGLGWKARRVASWG